MKRSTIELAYRMFMHPEEFQPFVPPPPPPKPPRPPSLREIQAAAGRAHKEATKLGHDMAWKINSSKMATGRCLNLGCSAKVEVLLDGKTRHRSIGASRCLSKNTDLHTRKELKEEPFK